jgi:uncharacterized protein YbaA (DUF1428 family)
MKKANLDAYKKMATSGGEIWMKHGALQYVECMGDDLNPDMGTEQPDMGKFLGFPTMTQMKDDETVIFSFITYTSRAHRDEVNAKVMQDPEMNNPENFPKEMPFTMDRMAFGGFISMVNYEKGA